MSLTNADILEACLRHEGSPAKALALAKDMAVFAGLQPQPQPAVAVQPPPKPAPPPPQPQAKPQAQPQTRRQGELNLKPAETPVSKRQGKCVYYARLDDKKIRAVGDKLTASLAPNELTNDALAWTQADKLLLRSFLERGDMTYKALAAQFQRTVAAVYVMARDIREAHRAEQSNVIGARNGVDLSSAAPTANL